MSQPFSGAGGNPFRAILDVGAALVSSLDLNDVFNNVARRIGEAMMVSGVDIETYSLDTQTLSLQAAWRIDGDGPPTGAETSIAQRPHLYDVIVGRTINEIHAGDTDLPAAERRRFAETGERTLLTAPLAVGPEVLGVLSLVERRFVRRFTSIEGDLFRQLCDLSSIAIHNARLYRDMGRQKRHMGSLLEASRALTSSLILEEVMTIVAPRVAAALDMESADIYEYRPDLGALVCVASWLPDDPAAAEEYVGVVSPLSENPASGLAIETQAVIEFHVDDPAVREIDADLFAEMQRWGEKSVIEVGMFFGSEATGVISLCARRRTRRLDDDEKALLVALASSASMAIHNARAFRRQEAQTRQLGSLLDAARTITSTVVLDEVLARVASEAGAALHTAQAAVYEHDPRNDAYVFRAFYEASPSGDSERWLGETYPLDENPGDRVTLQSRQPLVEQLSDPQLPADRRQNMQAYGERTALSIPLHFGDAALGILRLYEIESERVFSNDEIELAAGLGEQAAIAINNARLYSELAEQRRQLDSLLAISRALASSSDAGDVYGTIAHTAAEAFGSPRAIIYEFDPLAETITARAFFENQRVTGDTAGHSDQAYPLTPSDRYVLESSTPVLEQFSDMTLDLETRDEMLRWGEKTCLNVPLRFRGRPLGILMLLWVDAERTFTAGEWEFAQTLGEQAAIALHNARIGDTARDLGS